MNNKNNYFRKNKNNSKDDLIKILDELDDSNQIYFIIPKHKTNSKSFQNVILHEYCTDANINIGNFNSMEVKDFYTLTMAVSKGLSLVSKRKPILNEVREEYLELDIEHTREKDASKDINFDKLNEVIKLISKISFDDVDLSRLAYLLYVFCFAILENFDDVKKIILMSYFIEKDSFGNMFENKYEKMSENEFNINDDFFSLLMHSKLVFGQYMNLFSRTLDKAARHYRKLKVLEMLEMYERNRKVRKIRKIKDDDFFDEIKMMRIINDNMDNDIFKLLVAFFFEQVFSILVIISKVAYEVAYACDLVKENYKDNNDDTIERMNENIIDEIIEINEILKDLNGLDEKVKSILNGYFEECVEKDDEDDELKKSLEENLKMN